MSVLKNEDMKIEFIDMVLNGDTIEKCASRFDVAWSTISDWKVKYEEEIKELKRVRLAALKETYFNSYYAKYGEKMNDLEHFHERLRLLIESADLTAISPEKLLDLKLKYTQATIALGRQLKLELDEESTTLYPVRTQEYYEHAFDNIEG